MGFLSGFRAAPRRARSGAAFPAANIGRLTSSWTTDPGAINRWLRYELKTLRARSRQLARGDAYGAKFIRSCVENIAGPKPFLLQAKAAFKNGGLNSKANEAIELVWSDRCRPGAFEVTGKLSRSAFVRLVVRCLARDGEALVRKLKGPKYGGAAGQLQLLDIDRLDEQMNANLSGGGSIKMGVELDIASKPVAYHLLKQHPGELGEWNRGPDREHERVPADEIYHLFVADWPEQVRGFPWMHAAMLRLWNLGGFEDAAVINAKIGASKVATIQSPNGDIPASMVTGKDSAGNLLQDLEAGQYWTLPDGYEIGTFNPTFPDTSVGPFIQACLRGAAAAVNMAYHSFANDPGEVNFSTARVALLDERDGWMGIQNWFCEHFCEPDGVDWLRGAVLDGTLPSNYFSFRRDLRYQPKRWKWIDPKNEVEANIAELDAKLTSRTRIAAEDGDDIEEIFDELAAEQLLADEKNIDLMPPKPAPAAAPAAAAPDPAAATDGTDNGGKKLAALQEWCSNLETRLALLAAREPAAPTAPANINVDARTTVSVPEQPPANVNVDARSTVNLPEAPAPAPVNVDARSTVNLPEQAAPVVNVDARSTVNLPEAPAVNVDARSTVNVPEQTAPVVNVDARSTVNVPEQQAPVVNVDARSTVNVPEQQAPVVNVEARAAEATKPWPTETRVTEVDDKGRTKAMETRPLDQ